MFIYIIDGSIGVDIAPVYPSTYGGSGYPGSRAYFSASADYYGETVTAFIFF